MSDKIALKKLTASDLTLFHWHFRNNPAGKQKAINLNADPLVTSLYPGLPAVAEEQDGIIPVDLRIYGPGLYDELSLQRKIIKKPGIYKNWRLDGEYIQNPDESPERYNVLVPGDFALLEFSGDVQPYLIRMFLIAAGVEEDKRLHDELDTLIVKRSMILLESTQLGQLIERASPVDSHPIFRIGLIYELEDAALGGYEGVQKLRERPSTRVISAVVLERIRKKALKSGELGEVFVNGYLAQLTRSGEILGFDWVSQENAISPYDFEILMNNGSKVFVDVKSTSGKFENPIHISTNELLEMYTYDGRYDIYRIFELSEESAYLRISENLKSFAQSILTIVEGLPDGVRSDSISVHPRILEFGDYINIVLTDNEDEDPDQLNFYSIP